MKYSYAVVKSIFGDYWVGKSKNKPDEIKYFKDKDDAIQKAEQLFEDAHPDFDSSLTEEDENYNDDLFYQYEQISDRDESEIDLIKKSMENFVV